MPAHRLAPGLLVVAATLLVPVWTGGAVPAGAARTARPIAWAEAKPLVARLEASLPAGLRDVPEPERPSRWGAWVAARRQELLARLARGDEDSLVNLLLFGTGFTAQPRLTPAFIAALDGQWKAGAAEAAGRLAGTYRTRASDLVAAAAAGRGERMAFARSVLERQGCDVSRAAGRSCAEEYLLASAARVQQEAAALVGQLEAADRLDATAAFAERSRLFRERGLAPDTSVMTQYAVDAAVGSALEKGLLRPGQVRRVAVVGPGLDFVDKQEGYDFYPPQSLQPFAVIDSLLRRGAATALTRLSVTTLDVNPRVNGHLRGAVRRARQGLAYRLVLPLDSAGGWLEEPRRFWQALGAALGAPGRVPVPKELPALDARAVAVAPGVVRRLDVRDLDVVYDRLDLQPAERFDLVIATNVLVYYDTFEQSLALANITSMLRPGGLLVSNNALLEIPETPIHSAGYLTVRFSNREGDGEHMVFYRKE